LLGVAERCSHHLGFQKRSFGWALGISFCGRTFPKALKHCPSDGSRSGHLPGARVGEACPKPHDLPTEPSEAMLPMGRFKPMLDWIRKK